MDNDSIKFYTFENIEVYVIMTGSYNNLSNLWGGSLKFTSLKLNNLSLFFSYSYNFNYLLIVQNDFYYFFKMMSIS